MRLNISPRALRRLLSDRTNQESIYEARRNSEDRIQKHELIQNWKRGVARMHPISLPIQPPHRINAGKSSLQQYEYWDKDKRTNHQQLTIQRWHHIHRWIRRRFKESPNKIQDGNHGHQTKTRTDHSWRQMEHWKNLE